MDGDGNSEDDNTNMTVAFTYKNIWFYRRT